ncbi:MAG: hypothetical protein KF857_01710 [Fimbriimonadaceae bacterium]|nr:hypothetical protein [Fimbriimonadaceae bacterium]
MKTNLKTLLTIGLVVVSAYAMAQGGGGGRGQRFGFGFGGGMQNNSFLLRREDVQKDLKLTTEQKTKLDEIQQAQREKMREMFQNGGGGTDRQAMMEAMQKMQKENDEAVNKVLTADQQKRLKQIGIQLAGDRAILDPEVQKELGMTAEQTDKIKKLQSDQMTANQELMRKMRDQEIDRDQFQGLMEKNNKALNDEIAKIMTEEQKAKLKELAGPKFEADPNIRGGFGGGRPGGGGGRGGGGGGTGGGTGIGG